MVQQKEILEEAIQCYIKQVFSNQNYTLETKLKIQDMIKGGIIESFSEDQQVGQFKIGQPRLTVNSEKNLVTFWKEMT